MLFVGYSDNHKFTNATSRRDFVLRRLLVLYV